MDVTETIKPVPMEAVNSIRQKKMEWRKTALCMWLVFLVVFTAEIIGAYHVVYLQGHMMNDALSRTANAYYVIALVPHKLASIGFVWNPLPSLIQLLILPFAHFWKPLASAGFAGCITTALFAGINSALLFRYFKYVRLNTAVNLLIVALYTGHPFVFYYGFNGMSETLFFTAMIISVANFSMWLDDRENGRLVALGLVLVVAFLTRYEVFALMLGVGFAMLIAVYFIADRKSPFINKPMKMKWDYSVATGCVIFLPVLYSIFIWMFLNWSIMGDPLFFLRSAYSNESQSAVALYSDFKDYVRHPLIAVGYVCVRTLPFILPFIVITLERIWTKRLLKWDFAILVLLIGCMLSFHYVMLVRQKSFGWLRFYSFSLFTCIAWLPYELTQLKHRVKSLTIIGVCIALIASSGLVWHYFQDNDLAKEEYITLYDDLGNNSLPYAIEIATVINTNYSDSTILYDSFVMSSVTLSLDHPQNVITNIADDVYDNAVLYPQASGIDYIVIPEPIGVGSLDSINMEYPDLFEHGADWAELTYDNGYYRIYKVLPKEDEIKTGTETAGDLAAKAISNSTP